MSQSAAVHYPAACRHGPIEDIGEGIFFVPGSIRLGPLMTISRNMVVVQNDDHELTLVNPVRLSPEGEAALASLGTVRHLVRLGCFHGIDDPYCKQCYGAEFWAQPDSDRYPEPEPDHLLSEGGPLPIPDAELFVFRETKKPECALLIKRANGVLLTCDSVQHYGDWHRHSFVARLAMRWMGFSLTTLVGPLWLKGLTKAGGSLRPDFERLLELDFDCLLTAHGTPLATGAKQAVTRAVERAFQSSPSQ